MKFLTVLCFIIFVFVFRYSAESFTWTAPPPAWTPSGANDVRTVKYPVLNGSTNVVLKWNYTLGTGELVLSTTWQLDGTQIAVIAAITIVSDDRFDVKKSEVATLIIMNVSELEDATIQCVVQTSLGNWRYNIRLEITVPPRMMSYSNNQTVNEGSNLTLFCNATGKPDPNITWTRVSEDEVLFVGNPWHIVNINRTYSGTYRCIANNGVPSPVNGTITINILFKPDDVTLERNTTENNGCTDTWVNFTCKSSEANPPVHNYVLLRNETDVSISEKGTWIEKISRGETFVYKCQAYQQVDNVTSTNNISLSVKVPAAVEQIQNVTVKEGRNVKKECNVTEGTHPLNVSWKDVKTGQVIKGKLLTIINIRRNQSGEYRCFANNTCGNESAGMFIDVHYKPEGARLTTNAAQNTVTEGDTVTFKCKATAAVPQVSIYKFYFNGRLLSGNSNSEYTLNNVNRSQHYGEYKCVPHNDAGDGAEAIVRLNINVPVQFTEVPQNITVNMSTPLFLSCDASGFPEPKIRWEKSGIKLSDTKQLNINSSDRNNAGEYVCIASNGVRQEKTVRAYVTVQYPPTIQSVTTSSKKSWIGQTVTLKCLSDGVPLPTLYWYKPEGSEINRARARENKVQVPLSSDQDFGHYKCLAANGFIPSDEKLITINQIKRPGKASIKSSESVIQATFITIRWTAPAEDGGSPITGYLMILQKGETEIEKDNITDPGTTTHSFRGLERNTNYTVKLFSRNFVFEGDATVRKMKTKFEGAPDVVEIDELPGEITDDTITLKWKEPESNGKVITMYTVYQRVVTDGKVGQWTVIRKIKDVSVRELKIALERGKVYQFAITATNELGEGLKQEKANIQQVKAEGNGSESTAKGPEECNCPSNKVLLAIIGVLAFTILLLIIYIIWLHRKGAVGKQRTSEDERGVYDNETLLEDIEPSLPDSRKLTQPPAEYMDLIEVNKDNRKAQRTAPGADYAPLHPLTRCWEVPRHNVTIEKIIGKGAFGQVAKGTVVGLRGSTETTTVAIKMLKANATESDKRDLMKELDTMKQLKPHPYVIKLLGCVTESEQLLVLIEYVPFGDLLGYLRKSRGLKDTYYKDPDIKPQTNLTSRQLMKFAWQIADGMSHLSSKSIIHRDLAARNVLVGQKETCKVTDFGMARDVQQENIYERKTKGRLPVKWTAYEALLYGKYTTKSDVWSYGVLLYEIFTIGGSPYPRMDGRKIANLLQDGYRMPKPQHVDEKLYQIMMKCWKNDPDARPTFTELKNQLKEMETLNKKLINMTMYDKQLYANVEDLMV